MSCIVKGCGEPARSDAPLCTEHELARCRTQAEMWRGSWFALRHVLGRVQWDRYYDGVKAHKAGTVYGVTDDGVLDHFGRACGVGECQR